MNVFGCAICEFTQTYLYELQTTSQFSGSLPLLILGNWGLLITIGYFDSKIEPRYVHPAGEEKRDHRTDILDIASVVIMLLCIILFIRISDNPSFLLHQDRFLYAANNLQGVWGQLTTIMQYLIIIPIISIRSGSRKIGILTVAIYFLYLFWIGNKFGMFFFVLVFMLLVFYDKIATLSENMLRKLMLVLAVIFLLLVSVAVFAYSFTSNRTSEEYIYQRAAQEGQLWWGTYHLYEGGAGFNSFGDELQAVIEGEKSTRDSVGARNGIYKIMYLVAPSSVVDSKLRSGSVYTQSGFATSYYYFGAFGVLLFPVLAGLLISALTNGVIFAARKRRLIESVILIRLYVYGLRFWGAFTLVSFFDSTSLISYAVLVICFLIDRDGMITARLRTDHARNSSVTIGKK